MTDKLLCEALRALHSLLHPQNFLATHNSTTIQRRDKACMAAGRVLAKAERIGFAHKPHSVTNMKGITK